MNGTITYVSELKWSNQHGGDDYHLVTFTMENGQSIKSYVCPSCRNWRVWAPLLVEGNSLAGLTMRAKGIVDADSEARPA